MKIEAPAQLLARWQSRFPAEVDAALESEWATTAVQNGAALAQASAARLLDQVPWPKLQASKVQGFLGTTWGIADAVQAVAAQKGLGKVYAIQDGMMAVMETLAQLGNIAGAVPIIGMVAQIGLGMQRLFIKKMLAKRDEYRETTAPPWVYDKDSDEAWCAGVLDDVATRDLTDVFSPRTTPERLVLERVARSATRRMLQWQVDGQRVGWGVLPGAPLVLRGWQGPFPWSMYRPGAEQLASLLWDQVTSSSRLAFYVDANKAGDRWTEWWAEVRTAAANPDKSTMDGAERDRWRGNVQQVAGNIIGQLPTPQDINVPCARIPLPKNDIVYRTVGWTAREYSPQYPACIVPALQLGYDLGSLADQSIDDLYAHQKRLLRTRWVAYCSQQDPAFRDAELRQELEDMRKLILTMPAELWRLELDAIPDQDFRSAVKEKRPKSAPTIAARRPVLQPQAPPGPPPRLPTAGGAPEDAGPGGALLLAALAVMKFL